MIRVMVVEDEPPIAGSIKRLAEQYRPEEVRVVCLAINGRRALEYLKEHEVDLIFSDIKMPIMDGLALAEALHGGYPEVMMVIVSGFQEFEFARTAIRYGVQNYLLKPISRENIHEVLDIAKKGLDRRAGENKRLMLEKMISGNREAPAWGEESCGVALLCAGAYPLAPDSLMPDLGGVLDNSWIESRINAMLCPGESCICLGGKSLAERAIVFPAEDEAFIERVTRRLYDYLREECGMAVTLAVHGKAAPISQVGETFGKLRRRLYRETRLFTSQYLTGDRPEEKKDLDPARFGLELIQMMKTKDRDGIRAAFLSFVEALCVQGVRQHELMMQLERLMMRYFDGELSLQQLGELKIEVQTAITTAADKEELAMELADAFFYQMKADGQMEKGDLHTLCEEVAAYIRLHHRDNLTTTALGQQFGFSPTQLAKKFRSCFGISISEYLNKYRIELAQALMRDNKKLMIKEVAMEVGYNDQYYFSKTFKKLTGIWPTEYHQG